MYLVAVEVSCPCYSACGILAAGRDGDVVEIDGRLPAAPLVSGDDDEDLPAVREQEVDLAKRIETGLFAQEKLAEGNGMLRAVQPAR